MQYRRRFSRIVVISVLSLLGLVLFSPKPTWWIVQRDLGISVSLRTATVEVDTDWKRAPNGDGLDVVRLALDEEMWERVILNLDGASGRRKFDGAGRQLHVCPALSGQEGSVLCGL